MGGHGPIRYRVERYEPGRAIRFRLTGTRGVYGTHGFEIKDSAPGRVRLEHRLCMWVSGVALLSWPLMSIVGVDRIPYSYYRAKLAAEELVQNSGLPWSLLRATVPLPGRSLLSGGDKAAGGDAPAH